MPAIMIIHVTSRRDLVLLTRRRRRLQVLVIVVVNLGLRIASIMYDGLLIKLIIVCFVNFLARTGLIYQTHMLLRRTCNSAADRLHRARSDARRKALRSHILLHIPVVKDRLGRRRCFLVGLKEFQIIVLMLYM